MSAPADTALTRDQLAGLSAWLRVQSGARTVALDNPRRLSGGAISVNLALDLRISDGPWAGEHAVVLRSGAASGVSASLSKPAEAAVLRAAFAAIATSCQRAVATTG